MNTYFRMPLPWHTPAGPGRSWSAEEPRQRLDDGLRLLLDEKMAGVFHLDHTHIGSLGRQHLLEEAERWMWPALAVRGQPSSPQRLMRAVDVAARRQCCGPLPRITRGDGG